MPSVSMLRLAEMEAAILDSGDQRLSGLMDWTEALRTHVLQAETLPTPTGGGADAPSPRRSPKGRRLGRWDSAIIPGAEVRQCQAVTEPARAEAAIPSKVDGLFMRKTPCKEALGTTAAEHAELKQEGVGADAPMPRCSPKGQQLGHRESANVPSAQAMRGELFGRYVVMWMVASATSAVA